MNAKKLLIALIIILPLLVNVVQVRAIETDLGNGITVVETITTESPIMAYVLDASCKTQSHKLSFVKSDGSEVAWIKLNAINGCWNSTNMSLGNSTRTKGAATGYRWVLLGAVLGGKSPTRTTFTKYSNAELHMPGNMGYLTHQELRMVYLEPLNFHFSSSKTLVVWP